MTFTKEQLKKMKDFVEASKKNTPEEARLILDRVHKNDVVIFVKR